MPGSQLKYINGLTNLKALDLSKCNDLQKDLDYEGLSGLPPLVSLCLAKAAIDDRFMQYVLKYKSSDNSLAPGASPLLAFELYN